MTDRLPEAFDRSGYHQWIDHGALFSAIAKMSVTLTGHRTQATMLHAIRTAVSGTPGPVHLDVAKADAETETDTPPTTAERITVATGAAVSDTVRELARRSTRPLLLAGLGTRRLAPGRLDEVAARLRAPVLTTYKAKGLWTKPARGQRGS